MFSNSVWLIGGKKMAIPQGWGIKKLANEILAFKSGASISPNEFVSDGIEVIPKKAISESTRYKVNAEDLQFVPPTLVKKYRNAVVTDACVVTALRDLVPTGPNIGRAVEIRDQLTRLMAQGTYAFTINSTIDHTFYTYVTNINYFRSQMRAIMVGSTQVHIRAGEYLNVPFLAPPLPQQQKIAKILTTVDNLIEQTQALIDKYTAIKQGMMADLFTRGLDITGTPTTNPTYGQLRPSVEDAPQLYKETELGWVPKEWVQRRIDSLLEKIIDYRGKTPKKTSSGVPLITAKNIRMGFIDTEPQEFIDTDEYDSWMTRGIPNKGDILFTTEAPLGNVAMISTSQKIAFAQRVIILQTNQHCNSTFFKYYLMSENFRRLMFSRGSGSTVEGIKQSTFRKIEVLFPQEIGEQLLAAKYLEEIDAKISSEITLRNKYSEIKKGLMQDLLTGKVPVNA